MELTQRMDSATFARPSQRSSKNKIGFLGISGTTYPVVLGVNKVGRDPSCHVSLDNQTVSRQHAVVNAHSEREVLIMDMGSANGTRLENSVLSAYVPCPLKNGDIVQFGDVLGVFRSLAKPPSDDFPATQRCVSPPLRAPLRIPESPENSDLDDSVIALSKSTSNTFRNSARNSDQLNISIVKTESLRDTSLFESENIPPPDNSFFVAETQPDNSTINDAETQVPKANESRIFEAETQADNPVIDHLGFFNAETQVDTRPNDNSGIFTAETQVDRADNSRIFEAETQVDRPADKSDIFNAETQVDTRSGDKSGIFSAETQIDSKPVDNPGIFNAETQVDTRSGDKSGIFSAETQIDSKPVDNPGIFNAETQVDTRSGDKSGIFSAETQIDSKPVDNPGIFNAETQVDTKPCDISGIFNAETQVETKPHDNSGIFNAETQVPFADDKDNSIYEKNTQVPDMNKDIHIAETQVWLGQSPQMSSTPDTNTPEENAPKNSEKPNSENVVDGAETQIWPEIGSVPSPDVDQKDLDTAETQMWPEMGPVPSPEIPRKENNMDVAETQIWPELGPSKKPIKQKSLINDLENQNKSAEENLEEQIVSPTLPSPCKKNSKASGSISDQSDQEISFTEMDGDDDFMMCESQTLVDTDFDQPLGDNKHTEHSNKDIEDLPTQVLGEDNFKVPMAVKKISKKEKPIEDIEDMATQLLPVDDCNKDSEAETFENMATQILPGEDNCLQNQKQDSNQIQIDDMDTQIIPNEDDLGLKKQDDKEKPQGFEDMATQVLQDDDDDILTQIIPTSINLRKPEAFEDMLTQVIPEPETEKRQDESLFKIPQVSPLKKKKSLNVTPVGSPRKKILEIEENYYAATQDIMMELTEGRQGSVPVVGLRRGSGSSQSSSGDSQSRSFNQLCLDDLDLPNSQEINRVISQPDKEQPEQPSLSTSQLMSDSEEESNVSDILFKAPPQKKPTKIIETASRRSGRPRKPTSKLQEAHLSELIESDKDNDSVPSRKERKPRSRRKNENVSPTSEIEKARPVKKEPVELTSEMLSKSVSFSSSANITKVERKSADKNQDKKTFPKSKSNISSKIDLTLSNLNQTDEEKRPRSSRRIKEEKKSPTIEVEKSRRRKKDSTDKTTSETDLNKSDDRKKEENKSKTESSSRRRGNKVEPVKETPESDKSVVDLTKCTRTYGRRTKKETTVAQTKPENEIDLTKPTRTYERRKKEQSVTPKTEPERSDKETKTNSRKQDRNSKNKDLGTPNSESEKSVIDANSLRRSKRRQAEQEEKSNMDYSTAYDLDTTGRRKRSHGDRDSQKLDLVEAENTSRSKRARVATRDSQGNGKDKLEHRVLLTSFPPAAVADVKKLVEDFGGKIVEEVLDCTVLVSPTLRRTVKLLCCVGRGRAVVGRRWLEASAAAGKLLDPWKFVLRDESAEARYGCCLSRALRGPRHFLAGHSVTATPGVRPPPDELKKIVESSGGTWSSPSTGVLCITCGEDRASWARLRRRGVILLHVDFVLTGVLRQHADLEHFRIE